MVATPTDAINSFRDWLGFRMATAKHTRARVAVVHVADTLFQPAVLFSQLSRAATEVGGNHVQAKPKPIGPPPQRQSFRTPAAAPNRQSPRRGLRIFPQRISPGRWLHRVR